MRIKELDALRGLAAFAVFLFHFQLFNYGYLGVHLFFIVSGFVIFLTAQNVRNPLEFVIARFARLYPTYWVCLILTFAVLYFGRGNVTFTQLAFNITMFQEFMGAENVDGAYWSLTEELVFYGVVFVALLFGLINKVKLWAGIMLGLAIGGLFLNPDLNSLANSIEAVVKYFGLFVAGIIYYHIYLDQRISIYHATGLALCLGVSLLYGYGNYLSYFNHSIERVIICVFFALFTLLVMGKLAFLQKYKWLLFLGEISYPFYLLHQEIGITFRRLFSTESLPIHIGLVIIIFMGIAFIATQINRYVEVGISKDLKRKLQSWYKYNPSFQFLSRKQLAQHKHEQEEVKPILANKLIVQEAEKRSAP